MVSEPSPGRRRPYRFAGMSKEARRNARREVLLEAGIDVIGEVGIADTKVREVCARAELTERYFYESFPNFDSFVHHVVQTVGFRVAMRLLGKALPISNGQERLRAVAGELVSIFDEDRRVGRILLVETARAGGELAQMRQQMLYGTTWLMTMWLDNPDQDMDLAAVTAPFIAQYEQGDTPFDTPVLGDIDTIAIAGASAEMLTAWVDNRLAMTADELVDYVLRYIDQTVAWQKQSPSTGSSQA